MAGCGKFMEGFACSCPLPLGKPKLKEKGPEFVSPCRQRHRTPPRRSVQSIIPKNGFQSNICSRFTGTLGSDHLGFLRRRRYVARI